MLSLFPHYVPQGCENFRILIFLSRQNLKLANDLAAKRNGKEKKFGAMSYRGDDGFQTHYKGAKGEIAASILWKKPIDMRIFEDGGDDGRDIHLPAPLGVCQIKTTKYMPPYLRVECHHHRDYIDSYVAGIIRPSVPEYDINKGFDVVTFLGWLPGKEVITKPKKAYYEGGHLNYHVEEHELRVLPFRDVEANLCGHYDDFLEHVAVASRAKFICKKNYLLDRLRQAHDGL